MERSSEEIPAERIASNLARVRNQMGEAAAKAGRGAESVKLVAVTKYVGLSAIRSLYDLGVRDFGESRVQEMEKKLKGGMGDGENDARWHLIGHLQTNKADKAVKLFDFMHALDSNRVAEALNKERAKTALGPLPCMIEVNVAGEANKYGLGPQSSAIIELLKQCAGLSAIRIAGLMCMAPYAENPEPTSRPVFKKLRELFEQANASGAYPAPLTELSMGMTQDFSIAIEEGATLVRVGSALFE